jgi:hypothetical protein
MRLTYAIKVLEEALDKITKLLAAPPFRDDGLRELHEEYVEEYVEELEEAIEILENLASH